MRDGKTTTVREVFAHSSTQDDQDSESDSSESFEPERSTVTEETKS